MTMSSNQTYAVKKKQLVQQSLIRRTPKWINKILRRGTNVGAQHSTRTNNAV